MRYEDPISSSRTREVWVHVKIATNGLTVNAIFCVTQLRVNCDYVVVSAAKYRQAITSVQDVMQDANDSRAYDDADAEADVSCQ